MTQTGIDADARDGGDKEGLCADDMVETDRKIRCRDLAFPLDRLAAAAGLKSACFFPLKLSPKSALTSARRGTGRAGLALDNCYQLIRDRYRRADAERLEKIFGHEFRHRMHPCDADGG